MHRLGAVLGAVVVGATLSGCWMQPGYDAGHTNWNAGETAITPANVDSLAEQWSHDIGDGPATSLLAANGKVFAGIDTRQVKTVVGLDAATGDAAWTYVPPFDPSIFFGTNGVYLDGHLVFAGGSGTMGRRISLDPNSGQVLADDSIGGGNVTLAVADGEIAYGGGIQHPWLPTQSWVQWRCSVRLGIVPSEAHTFAFVGDGPGIGLVLAYGTEAHGFRRCDEATRAWTTRWTTDLGGRPAGVAAVGDDAAAYVDDTGTLSVLDAATGAIRWTAEVGVGATRPAVADGRILVSTPDGRLVAYAADTGVQLWEAPLGAAGGRPAGGGEVVYVPVGADVLAFALDGCGSAAGCAPLATLAVGSAVSDGPIVHDGRLLVGAADGRVVAFGLPG